jgi:hypothetical protein
MPLHVHSSAMANGRLVLKMGIVQTWYRVTAVGLEQGFRVSRAPASGHQLVIDLGSAAGWRVTANGTALLMRGRHGSSSLSYRGLETTDVHGTLLPSTLQIVGGVARIVVHVAHSSDYPLNIDPTWGTTSTPTATLTPDVGDDGEGAFGYRLALSTDGTTALVGANEQNGGTGAAYIFHVSSEGAWSGAMGSPTATLTDSGDAQQSNFGESVALSGDGTTALIGAEGVNTDAGAAYIFHVSSEGAWSGSLTTPTATLTHSGSNSQFGDSVALSTDGTTALIGAPDVSTYNGAVYVFHVSTEGSWTGTVTSPTATLTAPAAATGGEFGHSVALSTDGTTALIGTPLLDSGGAAYVYRVAGEGSWTGTVSTPTATLSNSAEARNDSVGNSVALSADGTTALIGAWGVSSYTGAAYIFHVGSESAWSGALSTPTAVLAESGGATQSDFAYSVTLSADGGTALIGADGVGSFTGAAYVFQVAGEGSWTGTVTTPAATLAYFGGAANDSFGTSVALSADATTALIGADGTGADTGSADVFHSLPAASTPTITNLPTAGTVGGGFTATVGSNGDGTKSVTSNSATICTASGLTVSYVGVGTCSLTAHVATGAAYAGADGTAQTFAIAPVQPTPSHGYWLVGSDGGIFTFGSANFFGSTGAIHLNRPVVGITPTKDEGGYWLVASDGGIFAFGDSGFFGSIPGIGLAPAGTVSGKHLNAPIVGMVPSYDGGGYFMVASDGGVFAFGDAAFEGSCPGLAGGCSGAAVGVAPDASGHGYWLVTTTGHVYTFGDAASFGAPGPQGSAITSIVRTPDGGGYWVLDAAGSVFAFGDAPFLGGLPSGAAGGSNPAAAIFTTSDGGGYWVATALGKVYDFGDAPSDGDISGTKLNGSIIAATGF